MESTSLASSPPQKRLKSETGSLPNSPSAIPETVFGSPFPASFKDFENQELIRLRDENIKLKSIVDDIKKLIHDLA